MSVENYLIWNPLLMKSSFGPCIEHSETPMDSYVNVGHSAILEDPFEYDRRHVSWKPHLLGAAAEASYIVCVDKREILSALGSATALFVRWMLYICQAEKPPWCLRDFICPFFSTRYWLCNTKLPIHSLGVRHISHIHFGLMSVIIVFFFILIYRTFR